MKYRKALLPLIILISTSMLWAGSLTVSSVSFKDGLGTPVEKDYKIDSYKITGKYMPTQSKISGQFSSEFSNIPATIDNLTDGDNWKIKVYAYDNKGAIVGESDEEVISIANGTSLDVNIVVDVPTLVLEEPVTQDNRSYTKLSDLYNVENYKLTYQRANDKTKTEEIIDSFPYTTTALNAGKYIITLEAFDGNGNVIASSGRIGVTMGEKGRVKATPILVANKTDLSFEYSGVTEENGYLYMEDASSFSLSAFAYPLKKDTSISYVWYISQDGQWKEIEGATGNTITSDEINTDGSFSLLCCPVINGKQYKGKAISINKIPDLTPSLFITGTNPISLAEGNNSVDITTVNEETAFTLDIPTYYLGKGIKAYYTLDGTKPDENSAQLTIGTSIRLDNAGENNLNILLVSNDDSRKEYSVEINIKKQTATPSISISNRDYGKDFYATLSNKTEGASIYYTLDGSEPDESSNLYTEPFKVYSLGDKGKITIKAIAIKDGYEPSKPISFNAF